MGKSTGSAYALGNVALLSERKRARSASDRRKQAEASAREGQTVDVRGHRWRAAGLLGVADPSRSPRPKRIAQLQRLGMRIVMLTGDNRTHAAAVARELGIDEVEADVAAAA